MKITFKIFELNRRRNRAIFSEKAVLQQERAVKKKELIETLKVGDILKGRIVGVSTFGAFVDIGGADGLIHISEVSWTKNVQNLQDSYKVGDSIESKVLFVDSDEQKISLGIKQLSEDPWGKISDLVKVGDKKSGIVNKVTKFGAFVSLNNELEGFIRTTDFHWTKNPSHPKEFVNEGDTLEYIVLEILEKERKVLLSVKDLSENPWEGIEAQFNSGDKIKGSFEKMNDSGIVIKLKDEIEGLIPMNKISKEQKKNTVSNLNEGDSLDLLVVEVKSEEKHIILMLDDSNVDD